MKPKVKAALIGISGYGDHYLESLLDDPRNQAIDLVGVADPVISRCKHLHQLHERKIPLYPSMSHLLECEQVDLVMLATPIHLHASQVCTAIERGINVLCEKPLASSIGDAARMLKAERSSKRFIGIGYQWSFSDAIQQLKHDIMSGALGRPLRLRSLVSFPRGNGYFHRNDWVGRIRSDAGIDILDSPVNNAAAHYLHNMLYLLGSQRHLSAMPVNVQAELYRANEVENYDTAMLRVQTDICAEVLFYTTHAMEERIGPLLEFEFERATVRYDFVAAPTLVATFKDGCQRDYGDPNLDRHLKIWQLVDAIHSGDSPACGVQGALPHALCALAAQRSMPGGIEQIPTALLTHLPLDDDRMVVVRGLNEVVKRCFANGSLPSELGGVSWAKPARAITTPGLQSVLDIATPHVSVQVRPHAVRISSIVGPA